MSTNCHVSTVPCPAPEPEPTLIFAVPLPCRFAISVKVPGDRDLRRRACPEIIHVLHALTMWPLIRRPGNLRQPRIIPTDHSLNTKKQTGPVRGADRKSTTESVAVAVTVPLVAVIVIAFPVGGLGGAVYNPVESIVPILVVPLVVVHETDHVFAVSLLSSKIALNCWLPPAGTCAVEGVTESLLDPVQPSKRTCSSSPAVLLVVEPGV